MWDELERGSEAYESGESGDSLLNSELNPVL